jgi:hypothetical protein
MRMNPFARGGGLRTLSAAFRFPSHIAVFPAVSVVVVVGVLALIVSNHSLRQKKNRRGTGEDMRSQLQDFFDRFGK